MSDVIIEKRNNVLWITLNREKKKNSICENMYRKIIAALDDAENDKKILIVVITGKGEYYSSGTDFSPSEAHIFMNDDPDTYHLYKLWVDRMIKHSKIIIAMVNGPAIGIACTTLALCDAVFASDKAYFLCPFTQLGITPEAASTSTFVQIMGYQKAARLAMFSERITPQEACEAGLVSKVIPHATFKEEMEKIIDRYSKLAHKSLLATKRLMRPQSVVEHLHTVNRIEHEVLLKHMTSEETITRIMSKFGSKI